MLGRDKNIYEQLKVHKGFISVSQNDKLVFGIFNDFEH